MAETQDKEQRTEPATPKRRSEARSKGQVARSQDLSAAVVLIAALVIFAVMGTQLATTLMDYVRFMLTGKVPREFNTEIVVSMMQGAADRVMPQVALITVFFVIVTAIAAYSQVGFQLNLQAIEWDFSKVNPFKGMGKIFEFRSLVRVAIAMVKATVIIVAAYLSVKSDLPQIALLDRMQLPAIVSFVGSLLIQAGVGACAALLVVGFLDYYYQKWQFEKDMRMTKQEVRDEGKQMEGDPAVKGQIRKKQREMASRRMMAEVPKATVVVTNPTHYAVALKYKTGEDRAPMVVAKGRDLIAQRIRQIATENKVPIVENKPLAQSLYRTAEIGAEIPQTLYRAVAELLSYVYRLRGKL